jgi:hypothetical protein
MGTNSTFQKKKEETMKRSLILIVGLLLCGLVITPAYADVNGSATAHVTMTVAPNITVVPTTPQINAGTVQNTAFTAQAGWTVHANMQEVTFSMAASSLYKGDDPTRTDAPPIGVKTSVPASFICPNANRVASGNILAWTGGADVIGAFPSTKTEAAVWASSTPGRLSQDCTSIVTYNPPASEQPTGIYSGKIQLVVLLIPYLVPPL